ncbi:MAG TPA: hypothetical protein VGN96_00255 [Roseococcus sp.]|jgi:hypothetical protein|nr:hypothetical protein [Roseococcus sp.]
MAQFEITAPDGRRFIITAPEGAAPEDVLRFAQQNMGQAAPEQPAAPQMGPLGQFGAGVNQRLVEVAGALPSLYDRGLQAVGLPRLFGNETQTATERMQGGLNALIGEPPAPQTTGQSLARGAGQGLVDAGTVLVPGAAVARATAPVAGQAPGLINRAATALTAQPAMQAAAGMAGGAVGEATGSPLAGLAAAVATPSVVGAAGRVITPVRNANSPARQALVAAAEREGIPVTAGQATGSRFLQNVESQLEQLPLTAAPQRAIREAQEDAFIRAAMRRTGTDATDTGPATITAARDRIGGTIGAIANRNTLNYTPQLDGELTQIADSLRFIPAEAAAPVAARIEQIRGMVIPAQNGQGGAIPGAAYRMMDSQLGRSMRNTQNGDLRAALGDLRDRLRVAMDASISPQDAAEWAQARREYANLMVIANAAGRAGAGAAEGRMSPVALRQALDQSTGGGYVYGRGDLNELARMGQSVLRPPPDSGTAGRTMAQNLLTGGTVAGGGGTVGALLGGPAGAAVGAGTALLLPRALQAVMNSPAGQAYLRNQLAPNAGLTSPLAAALLAQQTGAYSIGGRSPVVNPRAGQTP